MTSYDPNQPPDPAAWLAADADVLMASIEAHHRGRRVHLPSPRMHALIHMVVENQLAERDEPVVRTHDRLLGEGLTRHETIHANGRVLAEYIYEILKQQPSYTGGDRNQEYFDALRELTAEDRR